MELNEIWKPVVGYEDLYQVSNLGRVKSFHRNSEGDLMSLSNDQEGYKILHLSNKGRKMFKVHRLVAEAFLGHSDKPCVNHKNGIKHDNRLSNLEWATNKENIRHAINLGLTPKCSRRRFTDEEVIDIRSKFKPWRYTARMLAKEYNCPLNTMREVCKGKTYKWVKLP